MKKLLLASVLAIASFPGYAHATEADCDKSPKSKACTEWRKICPDGCTTHSEDAAVDTECGEDHPEEGCLIKFWTARNVCRWNGKITPNDPACKEPDWLDTECGELENSPPCPS